MCIYLLGMLFSRICLKKTPICVKKNSRYCLLFLNYTRFVNIVLRVKCKSTLCVNFPFLVLYKKKSTYCFIDFFIVKSNVFFYIPNKAIYYYYYYYYLKVIERISRLTNRFFFAQISSNFSSVRIIFIKQAK